MRYIVQCKQILMLFIVSGLLMGCAFGTREVKLQYPPKTDAKSGSVPDAQATPLEPSKINVVLDLKIDDRRDRQNVIGEVRNGYGSRTADVVAINSIKDWVTTALTDELGAAGFKVKQGGADSNDKSGLILSAEILTVYCTAFLSYEGEVSLIGRLQRDGVEVMNERYTGKGTAGLAWAMTSESYGQSLALALANAAKQLAAGVNHAIAQ